MALPHAVSGERVALLDKIDPHFASVALAKTPHMELIRLQLQKGKSMPTHSVEGEITLQCLQGEIACEAHGRVTILKPMDMLFLAGGEPHAIKANEDCVALLTILLPHQR
jgi:quercetin dioxygenase-like cupin family protein